MITGHGSHQIGLDADTWLTPMPNRLLTRQEREDLMATSMLKDALTVDMKLWTPWHTKLIKRAASYPEVERIFVHPAIKQVLCQQAGADRAWLSKVRSCWGHYYHSEETLFQRRRLVCASSTSSSPRPFMIAFSM